MGLIEGYRVNGGPAGEGEPTGTPSLLPWLLTACTWRWHTVSPTKMSPFSDLHGCIQYAPVRQLGSALQRKFSDVTSDCGGARGTPFRTFIAHDTWVARALLLMGGALCRSGPPVPRRGI